MATETEIASVAAGLGIQAEIVRGYSNTHQGELPPNVGVLNAWGLTADANYANHVRRLVNGQWCPICPGYPCPEGFRPRSDFTNQGDCRNEYPFPAPPASGGGNPGANPTYSDGRLGELFDLLVTRDSAQRAAGGGRPTREQYITWCQSANLPAADAAAIADMVLRWAATAGNTMTRLDFIALARQTIPVRAGTPPGTPGTTPTPTTPGPGFDLSSLLKPPTVYIIAGAAALLVAAGGKR